MSDLSFTFAACADLKRIWEGIAAPARIWAAGNCDNVGAAQEFADAFSRHCEILRGNPQLGPAREDLHPGVRTLPFQRYVLFYRLRGARIEVLRVLSAARDALGQA